MQKKFFQKSVLFQKRARYIEYTLKNESSRQLFAKFLFSKIDSKIWTHCCINCINHVFWKQMHQMHK